MKKYFALFILIFFMVGSLAQAQDKNPVLATVDGHKITEKDVFMAAVENMMKRMKKDKAYDLKRNTIDDLIDQYLLEKEAKKKGISVAVLQKQIRSKATNVTEAQAKVIYELQKSQFKGKKFDEIKTFLIADLNRENKRMAVSKYLDKLRDSAKVKINIERPRFNVSVDDDPSKGKKGAPITLIEFSEFQCPYCKRARPTVDKILAEYKGKVHYVFRDFPLRFHLAAKPAANAANCANEQGKYWEYNTELWENMGTLSKASRLMRDKKTDEADTMLAKEFNKIAKKIGLNTSKFDSCVASKKYFDEIDKDQKDGSKSGVSGTPAYFINGVFISGAQPFEKFKQIIDEELKSKKQSKK